MPLLCWFNRPRLNQNVSVQATSLNQHRDICLKMIKHILNLKKLGLRLLHLIPRQHHLNGTILHRVIGDRLFDPRLWKPTQTSVSAGLAIGIFIALTPTIGVQIPLIILSALFLRVNIPVALAASWVTNPLTAPIIYPLQYQLGLWFSGAPDANELAGIHRYA